MATELAPVGALARAEPAETSEDRQPDSIVPAPLLDAGQFEPAALLVMLASFGAFVLVALLRVCAPGGITEGDERTLYLLGGLLAPLGALFGGWLVCAARKRIFRDSIVFPLAMSLSNILFWAIALYVFKQETAYQPHPKLEVRFDNLLLLFAATNLAVFLACWLGQRLRRSTLQRQVLRRLVDDAYFAIPLVAAAAVGLFSNFVLARWNMLLALAVCGLPALARRKFRWTNSVRTKWVIDAAAIALIFGVAFNANYEFDVRHYSWFLGPTASLLGGRRPLVDVNCQYGVGVIYFLAAFFKLHLVPLNYQGMSAVLSLLGFVHFAVMYVLLRLCLRSQGHCLLALLVMLLVRVMSHHAFLAYPSLGPIRFLWGHLLLLFMALRERLASRAKLFRALELALVGVMSAWSVESFAGVMTTYLGIVFYDLVLGCEGGIGSRLRAALKRVAQALLAIAVVHALLGAETRLHTGQWPHWSQYVAYVRLYAKADSFWAMPIISWEPWAPVAMIYLISLTALAARRLLLGRKNIAVEHRVLWGMTVLGIVEFSHYIGRSHVDHLRVYLSYLFIAAYWMDRAARDCPPVPTPFRRSLLLCAYAAAGLLLLGSLPGIAARFKPTALGHVAADEAILSPWRIDEDAPWQNQGYRTHLRREAVALINKYQPERCEGDLRHHPERCTAALFLEGFIRPVVLMQVGKAHTWPIGFTEQDELEPSAKARVLSYPDSLKTGDVIYIGGQDLPALEKEILTGLQTRFRFSEIEASPSGIKVVRLDALGS